MADYTNDDIMRELGSLSASVRHGEQSRGILHGKIDELGRFNLDQVKAMTELSEGLKTVTAVAMQARDLAQGNLQHLHRFETEFREVQLPIITAANAFKIEAEPLLDTMRIVRNIVMALLGMGLVSIAGFAAAAMWAREYLAFVLRYVLGL